ncbi:hypothetical protein F5Y04DRAFT_19906 [Hypomontagnella monticulosa]|nr:hypothetical protein F5Y04DRAFT_19906 [Hypomontagnella monticulosa]
MHHSPTSTVHNAAAYHNDSAIPEQAIPSSGASQPQDTPPDHSVVANGSSNKPTRSFADLPAELREMIWQYALPEPRVFPVLVYTFEGIKTRLIGRDRLQMPLAHVCYESRQVVKKAGYILDFRETDEPNDPGVYFHPQKDIVEKTIWDRGDLWGLR